MPAGKGWFLLPCFGDYDLLGDGIPAAEQPAQQPALFGLRRLPHRFPVGEILLLGFRLFLRFRRILVLAAAAQ